MNTNDINIQSENTSTGQQETEQFKLAFEQTAAERTAISEDDVVRINVDIPKTVDLVFAHMPKIQALSKEVKGLPSFDTAAFDKIEVYTRALAFSQMAYNAASQPLPALPELANQLTHIRERLLADATALAVRGLLDGSRLSELKGGTGYKNVAYDVGTLVVMMRTAWPKIAGKTAVSEAELNVAQLQTERLVVGVAAKEQQEIDITAAGEQRSRAFTLLAHAYDEARRAATFLRWGQDIEQFVPSFYNGRGTSKKRNQDPAAVASPEPVTPATPTQSAPKPAPGLPGASPYAAS